MNIGLGLNSFAAPGFSGEAAAQTPSQQTGVGAQSASANNSGGGEFFATLSQKLQTPSSGTQSPVPGGITTGLMPAVPGSQLRVPGQPSTSKMSELVEAFLDEMHEKFQVTGQEVVQALSLAQTPQVNSGPTAAAQKFTDALGLQGTEAESAMAMYRELMAELKQAQGNSSDGAQKLVQLELISAEDFQKQRLNQSIDKMNQDFFRTPEAAPAKVEGTLGGATQRLSGDTLKNLDVQNTGMPPVMNRGTAAPDQTNSSVSVNSATLNPSSEEVTAPKTAQAVPLLVEPRPLRLENGAATQASLSSFNKKKGLSTYGHSLGLNALNGTPSMPVGPVETDFAADLGQDSAAGDLGEWNQSPELVNLKDTSLRPFEVSLNAEGGPEAAPEFTHGMPGASAASTGASVSATQTQVADFLPQPPTVSAEDHDANIRELIQKAEVLLKDGGGEMKIDMKPEGLGQVRLRVAVVEGRVQVQMISDNRQVRALLEDGALDLKNQLMAHSLKVDQIAIDKVDRPADAQMNQFNQQNDFGQSQQQREMARDFMEGFREERQAFRQSLAGIPSMGRSTQEREEIQPLRPSSRRGSGERRLDLVA